VAEGYVGRGAAREPGPVGGRVVIERAGLEDAEEILALRKLAYQSEAAIYDEYGIPPLTQRLEEIRASFQEQVFLKATLGGRVVGSVRANMSEGSCLIGRLIVHPDLQNQGIGSSLLAEIERAFGQARRFELFTGQKSERNLYLYRKFGYRPFRSEKASEALTILFLEKSAGAPGGVGEEENPK
jgi:GNAT superfamily N-acetyltransferase